MKFMDPTSSDHLQTSKMMKNDGKLRLYSIIDDVAKDINTMSYGKDGWSPMQCGNPPCVSKMVANHTPRISMPIPPINKPAIMPNKEIPTITFTFLEEELVDPHILAQTTPYVHPTPPPPPTSLQCITQKASTMFRGALPSEEILIAPLSWWPPIQLPCIPFKSIFPLSKTLPQSSPIIHLGQQIQCITSYIDLVNKISVWRLG